MLFIPHGNDLCELIKENFFFRTIRSFTYHYRTTICICCYKICLYKWCGTNELYLDTSWCKYMSFFRIKTFLCFGYKVNEIYVLSTSILNYFTIIWLWVKLILINYYHYHIIMMIKGFIFIHKNVKVLQNIDVSKLLHIICYVQALISLN